MGLVIGVAGSTSGSNGEQSVKICMGGVDVILCTGGDGFVRVWVCHVVLAAWCGESGGAGFRGEGVVGSGVGVMW